jgi:outer membrane receptor protein involved in Fe transport
MKRIGIVLLSAGMALMMAAACPADTQTRQNDAQQSQEQVQQLDDLVVKEKAGAPGIEQTPAKTVIELDTKPTIAVPDSIVDVLKQFAAVDFRGESEIDPGVDSIYLNGFDATRFVTALDGLTIQKTGGRKSSNIVDYALLPAFLIDSVEILPGPHSALYDSKSIGGVLNFKTIRPKVRDSLVPQGKLVASYGAYNTQTQEAVVQGSIQAFTYDLAFKHSDSDGYLRNNATDTDTVFGRLGLVLPSNGFVTLSSSYSDVDRETPVTNTGSDRDSDYPEVESAAFAPWQEPTWNGYSYAYRLNYEQDSPIGRLSLAAYSSKENRDRSYYNQPTDTEKAHMDTDWWQQGGKVMDDIKWSDQHQTTVGFDLAQLYDDGVNDERTERINKKGYFLQHQWAMLPSVDLRLGARYEDVRIYVTNTGSNSIPGREEIIERQWDQLVPKSFVTWKLDDTAAWLQDTSVSVGVSKIWRAPDYHGDYNPQGRPAGAWLEPEHGIGYDLVFDRRLWGDISLQLGYSYYQIEDYIASNSTYAEHTGASAGSHRFDDYKINLEQVDRHGVNLGIGGHLTDNLSFCLTYAWEKFYNKGDEPAGETALHKRAEHRVTAGLTYKLLDYTNLMLDYYYQSTEITEEGVELSNGEWYFSENENAPFNVFDIGVQQVLFKNDRSKTGADLRVYIKNLFDEEYCNASGYPAAGRTYGVAWTIKF